MSVPIVLKSFSQFTRKYPVSRGMIAYALLWPSANITQQLIQGRKEIDFREASRYSLFGAFYVAPTVFGWVKIIGHFLPGSTLRIAIKKALIEQVFYSPVAISGFYIGMGLLEGKSFDMCIIELREKFIPTFKTGVCFWPIVQTINFSLIKERNRVIFVGTASFFWTIFMSYMKQLEVIKNK